MMLLLVLAAAVV